MASSSLPTILLNSKQEINGVSVHGTTIQFYHTIFASQTVGIGKVEDLANQYIRILLHTFPEAMVELPVWKVLEKLCDQSSLSITEWYQNLTKEEHYDLIRSLEYMTSVPYQGTVLRECWLGGLDNVYNDLKIKRSISLLCYDENDCTHLDDKEFKMDEIEKNIFLTYRNNMLFGFDTSSVDITVAGLVGCYIACLGKLPEAELRHIWASLRGCFEDKKNLHSIIQKVFEWTEKTMKGLIFIFSLPVSKIYMLRIIQTKPLMKKG